MASGRTGKARLHCFRQAVLVLPVAVKVDSRPRIQNEGAVFARPAGHPRVGELLDPVRQFGTDKSLGVIGQRLSRHFSQVEADVAFTGIAADHGGRQGQFRPHLAVQPDHQPGEVTIDRRK